MGLKIYGRFSEEDTKILSDGIGVYDSVYVDTPDGNFASSEHGRSGLANAIELWKLIDENKSQQLQEIWDEVFDENKEYEEQGIMTVEQARQTADLLNELNERLGECFAGDFPVWREIRPEKLDFVRKKIGMYFKIVTESNGEGGFDHSILHEMWNFYSAWRFINVAARLGREVTLG